jgi:hypothetical protein
VDGVRIEQQVKAAFVNDHELVVMLNARSASATRPIEDFADLDRTPFQLQVFAKYVSESYDAASVGHVEWAR